MKMPPSGCCRIYAPPTPCTLLVPPTRRIAACSQGHESTRICQSLEWCVAQGAATSEPDGRPPPLHPNCCDNCQRCNLLAPLPPHTLPLCIAPPEDTSAISNTAKIRADDVDAEDAISDANQLFLHEWLAQERPSIYIQESNKYLMEVHTVIYREIHT